MFDEIKTHCEKKKFGPYVMRHDLCDRGRLTQQTIFLLFPMLLKGEQQISACLLLQILKSQKLLHNSVHTILFFL
jgi:hypothetical protein